MNVEIKVIDQKVEDVKLPALTKPERPSFLVDLLPLKTKQLAKLAFPPSCPVVHTTSTDFLHQVSYGVVKTAFLRFDTLEVMYQIIDNQTGQSFLAPQSELQFGHDATVWVTPPNGAEPVACVVLNTYVGPNNKESKDEVLYSVKSEEDGWVLHFCSSVEFRAATLAQRFSQKKQQQQIIICNSSRPPQSRTQSAQQIESSLDGHDRAGREPQIDSGAQHTTQEFPTAVASGISQQPAQGCSGTESRPKHYAHRGNQPPLAPENRPDSRNDTNLEAESCGSSLKRGATALQHSTSERSTENAHDSSSTEMGEISEPKRQRLSAPVVQTAAKKSTCNLVLPVWMDADAVKDYFYLNQVPTKVDSRCELRLRGGAIEPDSPLPYKLYIEVSHPGDISVATVFRRLEELFLVLFEERNTKRLFMYDMALSNPHYYLRKRNYVYQRVCCGRNGFPFQWTAFVDAPADLDQFGIVIGPKGKGIAEMQGRTACLLSVMKSPKSGVLISGDAIEVVEECVGRVRARFDWALKQLPLDCGGN